MYTLPKGLSIFQMSASIPSASAIYLEGWCPLKLAMDNLNGTIPQLKMRQIIKDI